MLAESFTVSSSINGTHFVPNSQTDLLVINLPPVPVPVHKHNYFTLWRGEKKTLYSVYNCKKYWRHFLGGRRSSRFNEMNDISAWQWPWAMAMLRALTRGRCCTTTARTSGSGRLAHRGGGGWWRPASELHEPMDIPSRVCWRWSTATCQWCVLDRSVRGVKTSGLDLLGCGNGIVVCLRVQLTKQNFWSHCNGCGDSSVGRASD